MGSLLVCQGASQFDDNADDLSPLEDKSMKGETTRFIYVSAISMMPMNQSVRFSQHSDHVMEHVGGHRVIAAQPCKWTDVLVPIYASLNQP